MATSKKTTKKKSTAKKATAKIVKKSSSKKKASGSTMDYNQRSNAWLALIIMGLLTVIVILVNNIYIDDKKTAVNQDKRSTLQPLELSNLESKQKITKELKNNLAEKDRRVAQTLTKKAEKTESNKQTEKVSVSKKQTEKVSVSKKKSVISPQAKQQRVKLYFIHFDEATEKTRLSSVHRSVAGTQPLEASLQKLIKGPTAKERNRGLLTALPLTLKIRRVTVRDRTAEIDFSPAIEQGGSGTILLSRIDQIVYTATQFNHIDSVVIKINGQRKRTLGSDGLAIGGPLHRR